MKRNNETKGLGINIKNKVDNAVPRSETINASEKRARFLPTTISPARYRRAVKTKRLMKKSVKENASVTIPNSCLLEVRLKLMNDMT
ncbi:hypothetical protein KAW04_00825 [Candidatus Bathyarchaeota archaeon]|nr:hypothetical protein [Candidatus Bathyarchaeota archaeon]